MLTSTKLLTVRPATAALTRVRTWFSLLGLVMALLLGASMGTPAQASTMAISVSASVGEPLSATAGVSATLAAPSESDDKAAKCASAQAADPDDLESDLHGFCARATTLVFVRDPLRTPTVTSEFLSSPLRRPPRSPRATRQA